MKTKFTYWLSVSVLAVLFFGILGFVYLLEETKLYPNIQLLHHFFTVMSFLSFVLFLAVLFWFFSVRKNEQNTLKELQELNEQLQENLHYLKTLINTAPIPIFIKDLNFCYEECNDAFLELFNLSSKDVLGRKDNDIFNLEFAQELQEKDIELSVELHQNYVLRINDDGITKVLEYHTNTIRLNGTLRGYIGFCSDITQTEEKELYLNLRVEQEVMKNLEMQRKHYTERMDDAKFTVIGKLAAGITHEINTPLTYVKGNIEILKMRFDSIQNNDFQKDIEKDFLQVSEGLKRIEGIVTSMREMSQQSGEAKEKVDIVETILMAITLGYNRSKQIATIELQGIPFEFGMKLDLLNCYVTGQKQRLEQVWVVLLNNALDELDKHGKYDENVIKISCQHKDNLIIVRFEDTGKGIDDTILDKLFDPFVGHKEYGGIGIGLNIAKKIVEDHNGSIDVHNSEEKGKGAIFEVVLPAFVE
jgi:two-component system, LuxR family, sensor kinase FixL